jgi:16S rRNA C967 or C1407 C5-methylase (RsmB/RsmF family)
VIRKEFISLLEESVGKHAETVLKALETEPSVSIRLNPSKLKECPFPDAEPIPWSPYGFILKDRPSFTLDPLFHAGCYYVQESSAMMVGHVFRKVLDGFGPGIQVLDLCAAPGGKTTDLASSLRGKFGDQFTLLANEVMRARYPVLKDNVRVWADDRAGTVSRDPSAFGSTPLFDIVLADVPCSGEGMFRKDPVAVKDWTPELPAFCAARSKRILADIWPTLKEGGILVYSTCTFNHLENEDTVAWIASELGATVIDLGSLEPTVHLGAGYAMLPGLVPGEGQYVAALRKNGEYVPSRMADPFLLFKAERPAAAVEQYPFVDVDLQTALQYLHGDALRLPEGTPIGLITITYKGQALGPAKNIGTRCNNLYPKANRIRMNI